MRARGGSAEPARRSAPRRPSAHLCRVLQAAAQQHVLRRLVGENLRAHDTRGGGAQFRGVCLWLGRMLQATAAVRLRPTLQRAKCDLLSSGAAGRSAPGTAPCSLRVPP